MGKKDRIFLTRNLDDHYCIESIAGTSPKRKCNTTLCIPECIQRAYNGIQLSCGSVIYTHYVQSSSRQGTSNELVAWYHCLPHTRKLLCAKIRHAAWSPHWNGFLPQERHVVMIAKIKYKVRILVCFTSNKKHRCEKPAMINT